MIDYLRNLFVSWFNKILNWFSERHTKKDLPNNNVLVPVDKNKHADDDRQKSISEGFKALDDGCKSIANLRAEIEMSQTESKTFKDNEPKVNNDLDAPVPANKQIKGNPLFQRDGVLNPFLGANAPLNFGCVAKERNSVSVAMANGCVANERHYVSNNIKNIGGNNMGNFFGPKTPEECQEEIEKHEQKMKEEMAKIKIKEMAKIKDLEKKKLELENKEGVTPIKPVGQEKVLPSNISPISMKSNNDNSNWMDPNDLNNTFEYQDEKVQKAMKGVNNKMGELINKKAEKIKQDVKKEMDDRFAESTNDMNNLKEQVNKNTEDIKKTQEEQIDIKKMLAKHDEMIADNKRRLDKAEKMLEDMKEERKDTKRMLEKMEEDKKAHDELMAALWNKLDEWNGIKQPTRNRDDNRESTNTSFSSFKYKNPFRNNTRQPRMERADMAHSHDENE